MTNTVQRTMLLARYVALATLLCIFCIPAVTQAATVKPTCVLSVVTPAGDATFRSTGKVYLAKGEELHLSWVGKRATRTTINGVATSSVGTAVYTPEKDTRYTLAVRSSEGTAKCAAEVHVVTATFTESTLTSKSHTPTLSGTASGTKSVQLVLRKEGSEKVLLSNTAKVKNGKWSVHLKKKLPYGNYAVTLVGAKNFALPEMRSAVLTLGTSTRARMSKSTLEASWIPLLTGGVAEAGTSVPVAYLQLVNSGKSTTTLSGFTVAQRGSAPASAIVGLTTVDDTGALRAFVGGAEGTTPFKNGSAFVPTARVAFAPGQMRLFTIKAALTKNIATYVGKTLLIDVSGITSDGSVAGPFPMRGAKWTIAY